MPYGYNGKRLNVNLTTGKIEIEEPDEKWYRTYLGGMASIAYHLLQSQPGIDPLDPENPLIMATGVITGAPFSGGGRNAVGSKSPLTGGFGEADVGGFWNAELKHAGFDELVFIGSSPEPVYLWIKDGQSELRDASNLWGLEVGECHNKILGETEDNSTRTALIGPAGERQVRLACVINDLNHVAGRCGLGAVMGAKKLKGVAVRGTKKLEYADPDKIQQLAKELVSRIPDEASSLHEYGTGALIEGFAEIGNLPTHNFRDGAWPHASKISAVAIKETYRVGMGTCYACAVRCKKEVELKEPYIVERRYGGPEYETLGALGSDCGVYDLAALCKANELCQRYGLDTIGTGASIAYAMECYENRLITNEDTNGLELRFGNAEALLKVIELIAEKKGIGGILAEGSHRASKVWGGEEFAVEVKGQEVPMHEPRLKRGLGLGYAVSPTGADHCHNLHDTGIVGRSLENLKPLGIYNFVPFESLGPEKVRLYRMVSDMRILTNCLSVCYFPPWRYTEYRDLVQAVTGWDVSLYELVQVAERALNLARVFNIREGFGKSDDWLPERFFKPHTSGALSSTYVHSDELENAISTYYEMMGWDSEGVPLKSTLYGLGIGWVTKHLLSSDE
ncbi:aldehyde ferredoxin oxidoreductase family protein [Thermoproteota archaeon]